MTIDFTAHNIRLDDGSFTNPELGRMDTHPWLLSAKRILDTVFPGDKSRFRLADLGCLEGGYSVEFARLGFRVLGLDVRESNIAACRLVKSRVNLPNLDFTKDDAWNIAKYGHFDAVFCCGLLYHFDKPKKFLEIVSAITTKLLILQTHFSTEEVNHRITTVSIAQNEALPGRWYTEFASDEAFHDREENRWASWDNYKSFWIQRKYLLQAVRDVGFDIVMEQFDSLSSNIAYEMLRGYYKTDSRGTFIGIKTQN